MKLMSLIFIMPSLLSFSAFEVNLKPEDPFAIAPGTPLLLTKKSGELVVKSFPV